MIETAPTILMGDGGLGGLNGWSAKSVREMPLTSHGVHGSTSDSRRQIHPLSTTSSPCADVYHISSGIITMERPRAGFRHPKPDKALMSEQVAHAHPSASSCIPTVPIPLFHPSAPVRRGCPSAIILEALISLIREAQRCMRDPRLLFSRQHQVGGLDIVPGGYTHFKIGSLPVPARNTRRISDRLPASDVHIYPGEAHPIEAEAHWT